MQWTKGQYILIEHANAHVLILACVAKVKVFRSYICLFLHLGENLGVIWIWKSFIYIKIIVHGLCYWRVILMGSDVIFCGLSLALWLSSYFNWMLGWINTSPCVDCKCVNISSQIQKKQHCQTNFIIVIIKC